MTSIDRYLRQRGNTFYYSRRIPLDILGIDPRGKRFSIALKTKSLLEARQKRNIFEEADEQYWNRLRNGWQEDGNQPYSIDALRVPLELKDLSTASSIDHFSTLEKLDIQAYRGREALTEQRQQGSGKQCSKTNKTYFSMAVAQYEEHLRTNTWLGKSEAQMNMSAKPIHRAAKNFIRECGDLYLVDIDRDCATKFYRYWKSKVLYKKASWSTANRDLGNLRCLLRHQSKLSGNYDQSTPFDSLSFAKPRVRNIRPSFTQKFVCEKWLPSDSAIWKMKNPALIRAIFVMIGTGCRPSEILNIPTSNIILDEKIPYIKIRDRDGRELKTSQSNRDIPLHGIALSAIKKQLVINSCGFEEFHDRETNITTAIGKFMRENPSLKETNAHTLYSFRHMAEDLAKDAKLDVELRMEIFGHSKNRPEYGRGFTLEAKLAAFEKMYGQMTLVKNYQFNNDIN